ncbi:hypothetical protein ACJ6WE_09130 [Streptomyces sp. MMS24-I31]|uniref:hypothetical protein n=1 Tax=Streptomyces sp. MMS24-I31 TaxID=3351563 RepID=UPI0038969408
MAALTKVQLADGRIVSLSETQVRAVKAIKRAGTYYAYDGISRATIRVLERLGLITVEWKTVWVETSHGYRGVWKQRPQLEWTARVNKEALGR